MRSLVFDKEPAYVLHRQPYQENSFLVQFLTLEHGCITVLARLSAKMIGKNFQQFVPMLLTCSKGGELYNLRHLEMQGRCLLTKPQAMLLGMYINELIIKLIPKNMGSRRLFKLYADTLARLADQHAEENTLRCFEVSLLEISGHGMQLVHAGDSHTPLEAEHLYHYIPGSGAVPHELDTDQGLPVCHGKTLLALQAGLPDNDPVILDEARRLMRFVIGYHLRGRDVNTRSIFQYLQGLT